MSHLTNAQIFKAIGLDDSVKPMPKYTLLICAHVLMDWKHGAVKSALIRSPLQAIRAHAKSSATSSHLLKLGGSLDTPRSEALVYITSHPPS
jgi:hypothetical protein